MNKQPEPILLLRRSEFQKITAYLMEAPTGVIPGGRLVEVLNILDNLRIVPAAAVPLLEQALRNMQPKPPPGVRPGGNGSPEPPAPSAESPAE